MKRNTKRRYDVPEPTTGIRIWVLYIRRWAQIPFDVTAVPSSLGSGEIMVNDCLTLGVTPHALWPLVYFFSILLLRVTKEGK